jgi:hypothetical protein
MRKVALTALFLSLLAPATPVMADEKPPVLQKGKPNALLELYVQQKDRRTPPLAYWAAVSICEVNGNWQDRGTWAGGLGIYTKGRFRDSNMGTWERFGGEQFASHPAKATIIEQVVVANRIAVFGWSTLVKRKDGSLYVWDRPAVGLNGWGCIKNQKHLDIKRWMKVP